MPRTDSISTVRARRQRIGELLVRHGWITGEQLIRAIQSQRAMGGRIGTCLLEMDALTEERLLDALAEQTGAPPISAERLRAIDHDVLALVPAAVAANCRAVPFAAADGELSVATLDVADRQRLSEIASRTRKTVRPHVTSEVRVFEALERHYGIECPQRYGHLLTRLNRYREAPEIHKVDSEAFELSWTLADTPMPLAMPVETEAESEAKAEAEAKPASRPGAAGTAGRPLTPAAVAQRLATVNETADVGHVLMAYLDHRFRRRAVFQVLQHERVLSWLGAGDGFDRQRFADFEVDLAEPSAFAELAQGFPLHRGPLESAAAHAALAACWGLEETPPCVLVPVWIRDHLVAVLYGDRGDSGLAGLDGLDLDQLETVASKAALAFELCILRRKILQPGAAEHG